MNMCNLIFHAFKLTTHPVLDNIGALVFQDSEIKIIFIMIFWTSTENYIFRILEAFVSAREN